MKTRGLHYAAAQAIQEYIEKAGLQSGPLFPPRSSSKGEQLAERRITERSMNRLLMSYLERILGAVQGFELPEGAKVKRCIYSPHSVRATTATLLLDSGVAIEGVQDLLDHKHITTTQIYDKRRRSIRDLGQPQSPDLNNFRPHIR